VSVSLSAQKKMKKNPDQKLMQFGRDMCDDEKVIRWHLILTDILVFQLDPTSVCERYRHAAQQTPRGRVHMF